ncbi:TIGR03899 family protein [Shewanella sp. A25]|nr:TIGR03899 family protein [Shewanella shenzhenensis]
MKDSDILILADNSGTSDASARRKALLLGRQLGLRSDNTFQAVSATITERAAQRARLTAHRYQANIETIFALALKYTPSDVTGVELDPDWSHQFFLMAEQIHNRKMQDLWARILASEIVNPGNFSLRTLALLKQLTHREAQILEKALGMSAKVNNEQRLKLINGYKYTGGIGKYFRKQNDITLGLSQFGLPYSSILTLVDAGILHSSEFETGLLNSKTPIHLAMPGIQMKLTPKSGNLLFSYYRLTPVGDELAQLVLPKQDEEYLEALKVLFTKDFKID